MKRIIITENQLKHIVKEENNKKNINILWLDDIREPNAYFKKERTTGAWVRNNDYYQNNIFKNYNVNFIWVKNLSEFKNYILNNPMPDLISFDHDLKPKGYVGEFENGIDCAKWLVEYCKEKNITLPKCYAHTANSKKIPMFDELFNNNITEEINLSENDIKKIVSETIRKVLSEVVYVDKNKIDKKNKKIGLSYAQGRVKGNLMQQDKLNTEKMDEDGGSTYEVPLKGGIMSYNITDIKGVQVMHYFKKTWAKNSDKVDVDVEDDNNVKTKYQLTMDDSDESRFLERFKRKVEYVIKSWINENKLNDKTFKAISIYPVPSSSNFNNKFVKEVLKKITINGLKVQIINDALLKKDLQNLSRDNEFIEKNKDFYNSNFSDAAPEQGTVKQRLDSRINRYNALNSIKEKIDRINILAVQIINTNNQNKQKAYGKRGLLSLVEKYKEYYDLINECLRLKYYNEYEGMEKGIRQAILPIKYSKGPSIENRKNEIWEIVKPYLDGVISDITGEKYKPIDICKWDIKGFEIKKLANSVRLGLKNYYTPNTKGEVKNGENFDFQEELNKIKETIFLIFDDNISGGATLSDICYQCKKLGIENIIPITFGKMRESNTMGVLKLNTPKNGYDFS